MAIFAYVISAVLIVASALLWISGRRLAALEKEAAEWSKVSGFLISLEIKKPGFPGNPGNCASNVYVKYSYVLHGKEYLGDRITLCDNWLDTVEKTIDNITPIDTDGGITVYVSPSDPCESVLNPSAGIVPSFILALSLVCGIAGGLCCILSQAL